MSMTINGSGTITGLSAGGLPAATINQTNLNTNVAGNGPACSVYLGTAAQNISSGTWTKIQLNTKEFDTASAFDNTTNYRFQPLVAGYYQCNGQLLLNNAGASYSGLGFTKTGNQYKYSYVSNASGTSSTLSALIYLNGSTDYVEMYGFSSANANQIYFGSLWTSFQASLVRAA